MLVENVARIFRLVFDEVAFDLEVEGFEVQAFNIPACGVGLDHWRPRAWICGYTDREGESGVSEHGEVAGVCGVRRHTGSVGAEDGVLGGVDITRADRRRMIGNSVAPAIVEEFARAMRDC